MTAFDFANPFTLGPLALYFIALAAANSGQRSRIVTGQQDLTALALGLIGFVMAGPIMLFLPVEALGFWGILTWLMLAVLYALMIVFVGSMFPPRLIVYNIQPEELRSILASVAFDLDQESKWCGNSLIIPGLSVQLYIEKNRALRNVSLIATGNGQDVQGWRRLEKSLTLALSKHQTSRNRTWLLMLLLGLGIGAISLIMLYFHSQAILMSMQDFLSS